MINSKRCAVLFWSIFDCIWGYLYSIHLYCTIFFEKLITNKNTHILITPNHKCLVFCFELSYLIINLLTHIMMLRIVTYQLGLTLGGISVRQTWIRSLWFLWGVLTSSLFCSCHQSQCDPKWPHAVCSFCQHILKVKQVPSPPDTLSSIECSCHIDSCRKQFSRLHMC